MNKFWKYTLATPVIAMWQELYGIGGYFKWQ